MKKLFKIVMLITILLSVTIGLISCNDRSVYTDKYTMELPAGYKKSKMLSDSDMQVYTKSIFSDNMISVTHWEYDDVKTMCALQNITDPTNEEMEQVLFESYISAMKRSSNGQISVSDYTLYEYDDLFGSTAAFYIFFGENYIYSIDFSAADKDYEDLKKLIPDVLDSFEET